MRCILLRCEGVKNKKHAIPTNSHAGTMYSAALQTESLVVVFGVSYRLVDEHKHLICQPFKLINNVDFSQKQRSSIFDQNTSYWHYFQLHLLSLGICGERKSMWNKLKLKLNSKASVVNFTSAATFPRIPYKRSTVKRRKTMCFSLLHSPSLRMTRCNEERQPNVPEVYRFTSSKLFKAGNLKCKRPECCFL